MEEKTDLQPEMIVIAGPNGSGKTSVTRKFLHHEWAEGVLYINPDDVAKDMFGDWNSTEAVLRAANYCSDLRETCLSLKKVDSQNQKTNANQTFTQTGALL